ncbi:hypothetical protein SEA_PINEAPPLEPIZZA_21 [Microbacterium phage PineapplePizza]|uniref:Uncharacterized protein n=1 Tax=Microbacterium phage PineapplePizza TaxID=2927268 RepID=A0A976YDJ0_9CAUD|nr:hypothetical protein QEH41_gp21 [Microbacterium phage PineapplePizza]UVF60429.1 hypothetical protein SEA_PINEAPPLEPIZZA_21 [Microbacterium phage PineapplePizza]
MFRIWEFSPYGIAMSVLMQNSDLEIVLSAMELMFGEYIIYEG